MLHNILNSFIKQFHDYTTSSNHLLIEYNTVFCIFFPINEITLLFVHSQKNNCACYSEKVLQNVLKCSQPLVQS